MSRKELKLNFIQKMIYKKWLSERIAEVKRRAELDIEALENMKNKYCR